MLCAFNSFVSVPLFLTFYLSGKFVYVLARHLLPGRLSLLRTVMIFTCHASISLFAIIFSPGQEITYLTAQQWEREGWEMHQRNRLISFGEKTRGLLLACNWETKAKVIAVELELGEGKKQQLGCGTSPEAERNKRWFFRICRWGKTVFILPRRLFVPKQSHFVRVFDLRQFSTDDAGSEVFGNLSWMTLFIATETVKNSWYCA